MNVGQEFAEFLAKMMKKNFINSERGKRMHIRTVKSNNRREAADCFDNIYIILFHWRPFSRSFNYPINDPPASELCRVRSGTKKSIPGTIAIYEVCLYDHRRQKIEDRSLVCRQNLECRLAMMLSEFHSSRKIITDSHLNLNQHLLRC